MSYGFKGAVAVDTITLPKPRQQAEAPQMATVLQAGAELGFVSRDTNLRRKPGPKRTEPQDKITVTGAKKVIDRFKAHCDAMGGVSYCDAIAALLDKVEKQAANPE